VETARRRRQARERDLCEAKAGLLFVGKKPYGGVVAKRLAQSEG
jgi:hypothetical protein